MRPNIILWLIKLKKFTEIFNLLPEKKIFYWNVQFFYMKLSIFYRKNKYMEKKSFLPEIKIIIHDGKIAAIIFSVI